MMSETTNRTMAQRFTFRILLLTLLTLLLGGFQLAYAAPKTKTKADVVNDIAALTMPSLPIEIHRPFFEGIAAAAPGFVHETMSKSVAEEIDKDTSLSDAQKASLKAKIPDLLTRAQPSFKRIVDQKFGTVEAFLVQGLKDDLTGLSIGEVIEVHTFLTSDAGKSYMKAIQTISRNVTAGKPKPLEIQEKHRGQTSDFLNSVPGKKYNDVMLSSPEQMQNRMSQLMTQVFEEINKDAELDRMYKEFKGSV